MFKTKKAAAGLLCLILLCITASCGDSASESGFTLSEGSFTLEDMANANTADAIFKTYKSVRSESKFYNLVLPGDDGTKGDFSETAVFTKENGAVTAYASYSDGYKVTVENGRVYYQEADNTYGMYAFFDDGYFDEYYLPNITKNLLCSVDPGEKLISQTVEGGIRKLTTRMSASNIPDAEAWGIQKGTLETIHELDAKSGLLQRVRGDIFTEENPYTPIPFVRQDVTFGKDDNFQPPEYVTRCKDMTKTRTVRYVRNPGTPNEKTFTFTLPKSAAIYPAVIETYAYFEDAACTVPYKAKPGAYPDELTVYMKEMIS